MLSGTCPASQLTHRITGHRPEAKKWSFSILVDIIELLHRDAGSVSGAGPGLRPGRREQIFHDAVREADVLRRVLACQAMHSQGAV